MKWIITIIGAKTDLGMIGFLKYLWFKYWKKNKVFQIKINRKNKILVKIDSFVKEDGYNIIYLERVQAWKINQKKD